MAFALRASAFAGDVAQLRSSGESSSQSGRCSAFVVTAKESRIGKNSVKVPKGVTVTVKDNLLVAKGPKGELSLQIDPLLSVETEADGSLRLRRVNDTKRAQMLHGLSRTLTNNVVVGVSTGFEKKLQLQGVGYKAAVEGTKKLNLALGLSHPVEMPIPAGLAVKVDANVNITVTGIDKYLVGQFAADIREKRKPEPYKGKGIRYVGEVITLKEGKRK